METVLTQLCILNIITDIQCGEGNLMDDNAKRERLEIMIERRIIMEERKELEKNRRAERHQAFLERQAGVRGLRRSEQVELQKLQRDKLAEAQEMRKLIQGARLAMWRMR